MPIPPLQPASPQASNDYWLPPGIHECTAQEVEAAFLYNDARRSAWNRFEFFLRRVHAVGGTVESVYVNGSFVTGREEPDDVDGVAFVLEDDMLAWAKNSSDHVILRTLICEGMPRLILGADLFFVSTHQELDRLIHLFTHGLDHGLPRPDPHRDPTGLVVPEEKGILRVDVTGLYS